MARNAFLAFCVSALIALFAPAAQALTSAEVSDGLEVRITQAESSIEEIETTIGNTGSPSTRAILQRALRLEQARLRQMETFLRLVDRFPQARLLAIVEYFDLPVSRS